MITSMTGHGVASGTVGGLALSITVRGVNHKGLDLRVRAPDDWGWFEQSVRKRCRDHISRGRVEFRVDVQRGEGHSGPPIDQERFAGVVHELEHLVGQHGLSGGVTLSDVFAFDEVLESSDGLKLSEESRKRALEIAYEAFDRFVEARVVEGLGIARDVEGLIDEVDSELEQIVGLIGPAQDAFHSRLEARLQEALDRFSNGEIDDAKLAQEFVFYADRSDVSEELQRSLSHVAKLREVVRSEEQGPRGKTIDFYLQELMREANTLGAKTSSVDVTDAVIRVKTAVEKLREQAANIE